MIICKNAVESLYLKNKNAYSHREYLLTAATLIVYAKTHLTFVDVFIFEKHVSCV